MGYLDAFDPNKFRPGQKTVAPPVAKVAVKQPSPSPAVQNLKLSPDMQTPVNKTPVTNFRPQPIDTAPSKSIIGKIFDALAIPSQISEKLLTGGKGYEQKLKEDPTARDIVSRVLTFNMPEPAAKPLRDYYSKQLATNETARNITGSAGRIVVDPLNFVPVSKIATGVKILSKASKLDKGAEIVKNVVSKIPGVQSTVEAIGKNFVKGYKLPEEYNVMKSEIPTTVGKGATDIIERTKQQFGQPFGFIKSKLTGKQTEKFTRQEIEAIPKFLEPKGAGSTVNLGELRKTLGEESFNRIRPVLSQVKKQFDADITDLVQRGRMAGETAKRLLNQGGYYPHLDFAPERIKEYFTSAKFGERRTYLTKRKGAEGFTFNAPKAIAKRELAQFQDNAVQDFLREVKTKFGVKIGAGNAVPEGFKPILSDSPRLRELKGWAFPARIVDDLNASAVNLKETPYIGKLFSGIDMFNKLWKPTATSMNPAFHFMNAVGNLYNSWLGGMKDPIRFIQGVKGGFSPEEMAILKKSGVLDRGAFNASNFFNAPSEIDAVKAFEPFRKLGNTFENNARSAFFLDQRQKFLSKGLSDVEATRKAIAKTNEYLFDYLTGLTPFETNVMRRFFPFYTWARFNIPLQLKSLVTQPGKNALVAKLNKELNKEGRPEGDYPGISIPTPFVDEKGNQIRYRPNLPVQDIFSLMDKPLGMLTPVVKEGTELGKYALSTAAGKPVAPKDLFTGQDRTDVNLPMDQQIKDIVGSEVKGLIRPLRSVSKAGESDFSPAGIVRQLIGGTYTINPESVQLRAVNKRQAVNSAIENRIQQILRSNMSNEQKRDEIRRLEAGRL